MNNFKKIKEIFFFFVSSLDKKLGDLISSLHRKLKRYLEHKVFRFVLSLALSLNMIAFTTQLMKALVVKDLSGISIITWLSISLVQTTVLFEGINLKSKPVCVAIFYNACVAYMIVATLIVRQ